MSPISTRRRKARRGSTIVELAFIFLVFFCMLIACFDFGQFLFVHQALVQRARWAARSGVIGTNGIAYTPDQIRNLVIYGATSGSGTGYFGLTSSMVTVNNYDANTDAWRTEVKISHFPFKMLTPYLAGNYTGATIVVDVPRGMYD
jgi:Flp pilus assembly protein TadG